MDLIEPTLENEELDLELDLGLASLDEIREIKRMLRVVETNFKNLARPKLEETLKGKLIETKKSLAKQWDRELEVE